MIRFIIIVIILFLYLILGIPVLGIEWLIGKFNKQAEDYQCLRMVQKAFRLMLKIAGTKITVIGEENIPDEAVLFIGNHRSYFDILLTYSRCKRLTGYIAKKEMLSYPVLRTWMKRLYCLFLDRDNMREGLKTIGEELSLLPFHAGSFKIAEKTGCPIIPVSMNNTISIFEKQFPRIRKTHVIIEYGKPIYPNELDKATKKRLSAHCQQIIQDTINRNQALV